MKRRKNLSQRLCAGCLAAALALGAAPAALGAEEKLTAPETSAIFADVLPESPYAQAVAYCYENGLMNGVSQTLFAPETAMTRAMMVQLLCNLMDGQASGESSFTDVTSGAWYAAAFAWAEEAGIVQGSGGAARPGDPITRQEAATLLWRCLGQEEWEGEAPFPDAGDISSWAAQAVAWCAGEGLLTVEAEEPFLPRTSTLRCEAAELIMEVDRYLKAEIPDNDLSVPENPSAPEEIPEPEESQDPEEAVPPLQIGPEPGVLLPNPYDPDGFVVENGFLTYNGPGVVSRVGIDVSTYQKDIDWAKVAEAGVEFAMLRVGYRGYTQGGIYMDNTFLYNIEEALKNGIEVGIYFFSQAVTEEEAVEEARQTLEWIEGYDVTFPVVFDWERISVSGSRTRTIDGQSITNCARAFCETIAAAGYTPMTYGSPSKIGVDLYLDQVTEWPFWLAHYTTGWVPSGFAYAHQMWQYTSQGRVPGIQGNVDMNIFFTLPE